MALGNWATIAWDLNTGKLCEGVHQSKTTKSVEAEVYKNWIYVHDKDVGKRKKGDSDFSSDVVMHYDNGDVKYRGLSLLGRRMKLRHALFYVVHEETWKEGDEFNDPKNQHGIVGLTGYGYYRNGDFGLPPRLIKSFFKWLHDKEDKPYWFESLLEVMPKLEQLPEDATGYNQGSIYFIKHGVDPALVGYPAPKE